MKDTMSFVYGTVTRNGAPTFEGFEIGYYGEKYYRQENYWRPIGEKIPWKLIPDGKNFTDFFKGKAAE